MKSFSFISGNTFDASRGMTLVVDRSRLPSNMNLGMWLDDDGKAFPALPRTIGKTTAGEDGEVVFVDATRLRLKIGGVEAMVSVAAGTRVEIAPKTTVGEIKVTGASVTTRGTRRFAQLTAPKAEVAVDKQPNAVHVFTLDAEKPAGAPLGAAYRVDVAQRDATGTVVGGVTVVFKFDT